MKKTLRYETFDNEVFPTEKEARKYLDKIYGDRLLKLTHKLSCKKYSETAEIINDNILEFVYLKQIKDDLILMEEE